MMMPYPLAVYTPDNARHCVECEVRWVGEERSCFICGAPGKKGYPLKAPFWINQMRVSQENYEEESS